MLISRSLSDHKCKKKQMLFYFKNESKTTNLKSKWSSSMQTYCVNWQKLWRVLLKTVIQRINFLDWRSRFKCKPQRKRKRKLRDDIGINKFLQIFKSIQVPISKIFVLPFACLILKHNYYTQQWSTEVTFFSSF